MADFDLGGLLFGNAPSSGLESYLDPEQLKRMQNQGVMQAAMALLKASGPSAVPIGIGQALGEAYGAGQAGYQQAQQQGIAGLLTKQKLEEAKRAQQMQEDYANMVMQLTGGQGPLAGTMTPESALAVPPTADLPVGPTIARSQMIGQPMADFASSGGGTVGSSQMQRANLPPQMAALLSRLPAKEGIPELMKYMQPAKTVGEPFKGTDGNTYIRTETGGVIPFTTSVAPKTVGEPFRGADGKTYVRTETGDVIPFATGVAPKPVGAPHPATNAAGKAVLIQSYDDGSQQEVSGISPYEASPTEVKLLREAGQPITMENIMSIRRSGASNVSVNTGEKVRAGEINKDIVAQMGDFTQQARSANETLMNVDRMLPALKGAITGPLADSRTALIRVGQQLGVVGKDANDVLAKTQILVQGLAQQELSAAGQMKGQGAITAPERELLRRAAVGDQSLSAIELKTALETAQKVAQYRIGQHKEYLSKFSALPGSEQYVPFYTVTPYQPAGSLNPMQSGIDAELAKRAQQQRGGGMR